MLTAQTTCTLTTLSERIVVGLFGCTFFVCQKRGHVNMRGCTQCLALLLLLAPACCNAATANKRTYNGYNVHVVFSNHLDVGFTNLDSKVIDLYFHQHLPHAAQLAKDLAASPNNTYGDSFRYLSHSWLLSLFLDCPPNMGWTCPNATEVALVTEAIQQGVITWHAMPFNPQYEVFDSSLLRFAVGLTHSLDDKFKQAHKRMASLRDVPGVTRAAIPVLASQGVKALTSGVNGFSAPPGVPKTTPFIWLDEQTGSQLIYMVHPGGYAGVRADGLHIDSHRDCIRAPGLRHVLCSSWGDDNLGPPADVDTVLAMFAHVRQQWPGATVRSSTLEDYLDGLLQAVQAGGLTLPVVTGEVGDTWIHGIGSDPGRMADYRAVLRARRECEADKHCDSQSGAYFNFSRLLLKVPEHTWGVSFNQYFGDFTNYTNDWLHQHLREGEDAHPGLAMSVESWRRQRRYIDWALEALPRRHPILASVEADRSARQAASGISPDTLTAAGAQALLPHESAAAGQGSKSARGQKDARSILQTGRQSGHCFGLLAKNVDGDAVAGRGKEDLVFCSTNWLVQVDRRTGGVTRLQRVYGEGDAAQLGNDWAGGTHKHHCSCEQQQQQQQQQQQPETAEGGADSSNEGASWVQKLMAWWHQHKDDIIAWLPSPDAAAAVADFAVGDEAQHAAAGQSTAAAAAEQVQMQMPQQLAKQTGRVVDGDADAATAVYRRLLSLNNLWNPGADDLDQKQQWQQWQDQADSDTAGSSSFSSSSSSSSSGSPCNCSNRRRGGSAFAELQYNVYSLQDYDPVWEHYAYIYPVWVGDFGKNNMSASINMSREAMPRLVQAYDSSKGDGSLHISLELSFPHKLVKHAGAPAKAWLVLASAADSTQLQMTLVWQNKTATRLPEALWLRFKPGKGAVTHDSWLLHKLDGAISPSELVLNGSHSLHAINRGVSVKSKQQDEQLHIGSVDVPLLNVGAPNPLPNPCKGPDMREGVAFNPVNNIWGTNYAMWVPFIPSDATMAFRFFLDAQQL